MPHRIAIFLSSLLLRCCVALCDLIVDDGAGGLALERVTDPWTFLDRVSQAEALRQVRAAVAEKLSLKECEASSLAEGLQEARRALALAEQAAARGAQR